MIAVAGGLAVCMLLEGIVSLKLRYTQPNGKDTFLQTLVYVRNSIAVLNVIPVIQLLGILLLIFVVPFILFTQVILIIMRLIESSEKNSNPIGT